MKNLLPHQVVAELDKHIVGQSEAKRFVATALRNRWRRMSIKDQELQKEIFPKNILLIGPTGVGKTEIARRLASLADAPFIKIEATKFTEVGYVGRDVESIIRDFAEVAYKKMQQQAMDEVQEQAHDIAVDKVLSILLPKSTDTTEDHTKTEAYKLFKKQLEQGELDEKVIEIDVDVKGFGVEIMAPPGMEEMTNQLQGVLQNLSSNKTKTKRLAVKEALKILQKQAAKKLINEESIKSKAINILEQRGIVFIDEIDKIATGSKSHGDVSREGVQRDLLPIIEGCRVNTKYGTVNTEHILFIASGAFHMSKPSDLIPELQGRLPVRVELNALTVENFEQILLEPKGALTHQYIALLNTEEVELEFTKEGINAIAKAAYKVNETTENIGARRLHTVLENILDEVSYDAHKYANKKFIIDANYVNNKLSSIVANEDLSRYIL